MTPPLEVGIVAYGYALAVFAGLLLGLAFLVEVVAPALLVLVRALAPRVVYAASFAATWVVVLATAHMPRQRG